MSPATIGFLHSREVRVSFRWPWRIFYPISNPRPYSWTIVGLLQNKSFQLILISVDFFYKFYLLKILQRCNLIVLWLITTQKDNALCQRDFFIRWITIYGRKIFFFSFSNSTTIHNSWFQQSLNTHKWNARYSKYAQSNATFSLFQMIPKD